MHASPLDFSTHLRPSKPTSTLSLLQSAVGALHTFCNTWEQPSLREMVPIAYKLIFCNLLSTYSAAAVCAAITAITACAFSKWEAVDQEFRHSTALEIPRSM